jgi:hypothetical protein
VADHDDTELAGPGQRFDAERVPDLLDAPGFREGTCLLGRAAAFRNRLYGPGRQNQPLPHRGGSVKHPSAQNGLGARPPVDRITTLKFVALLIHRGRRLRTAATSRSPVRLLSSIHSRGALSSHLLTEPVAFPQLVHRARRSSVCPPERRA